MRSALKTNATRCRSLGNLYRRHGSDLRDTRSRRLLRVRGYGRGRAVAVNLAGYQADGGAERGAALTLSRFLVNIQSQPIR